MRSVVHVSTKYVTVVLQKSTHERYIYQNFQLFLIGFQESDYNWFTFLWGIYILVYNQMRETECILIAFLFPIEKPNLHTDILTE